jgi:hypothetical protein
MMAGAEDGSSKWSDAAVAAWIAAAIREVARPCDALSQAGTERWAAAICARVVTNFQSTSGEATGYANVPAVDDPCEGKRAERMAGDSRVADASIGLPAVSALAPKQEQGGVRAALKDSLRTALEEHLVRREGMHRTEVSPLVDDLVGVVLEVLRKTEEGTR